MKLRRFLKLTFGSRPLLHTCLLLLLAVASALGLQSALQLQKERSILLQLTEARVAIEARQLEASFRRATASGLMLYEAEALEGLIRRIENSDAEIQQIQIIGLRADHVIFKTSEAIGSLTRQHETLLRQNRSQRQLQGDGTLLLGYPLSDHLGRLAGGVWFEVNSPQLFDHLHQLPQHTVTQFLGMLAAACLLVPLGVAISLRRRHWLLRTRLLGIALLIGTSGSLLLSALAFPEIEQELAPALDNHARTLASSVAGRVGTALRLGIPLQQLQGVDAYLAEALQLNPKIMAIELRDAGNRALHQAGRIPADTSTAQTASVLDASGQPLAQIRVWCDPDAIRHELHALIFDMLIVLVASLVLLNESLGAILAGRHLHRAGHAMPAHLGLGRFAVFLLILSEEVTRAFLPLYINQLAPDHKLLGLDAVSLPIAAYMASFALLTPFAGRWAARWGTVRIFTLGCLLSSTGFVWVLLDDRYLPFMIARCLCAAGYAIGTMAMQQHFLQAATAETRVRTLALFIGAVQTAAICGAPLGGMLAEQFGPRAVFAAAVGLGLLALLLQRMEQTSPPEEHAGGQQLLPLLTRPAVWAPLLGAALPAKLVLAGFLFYLTPLALQQESYGSAATGRAMMCYFLLVATINPLASWLADRYGWRVTLVLMGGCVIGAGGLAGIAGGFPALMAGIFTLGIGTGLSAAALQAMLGQQGSAAIVLLRTVERLGSVLGPLVAGVMLGLGNYQDAMTLMGSLMLAATLALAVYQLRTRPTRNPLCDASST